MTFYDILRILWQNVTKWSVTFCDKQEFLWHFKTCLLASFWWINRQSFFSFERVAKYSIMVRTGVVGEHFSVAHPSHGQVGFIPGVVKLSQGDLVSLDLVFPFQAIITAHWPCASMPSPCKSRNEHGTTGVWDTCSQILSNPCWMTSLGFDKLLACRGPLISKI